MLNQREVEEVFSRLAAADRRPAARGAKITPDPFRAVVGCILSAQSLDRNTDRAARALFARAATPEAIIALPEGELETLIRPSGLYNMKARNLRALCRALIDSGGEIPHDRAGLMRLPGVGRKCADIVLRFTFDQPVVAVDTHVHRLANRLGLARGRTEAQTAASLEPRVPERHRRHAHIRLIRHAKRTCTSRRPDCASCILADLCPSAGAPAGTPAGQAR